MLVQQRLEARPVLRRDVAIAHGVADQVAGLEAAVIEQMNDRQRDLAFAQVAADRLAERFGGAGEVQQIVDELEHRCRG